MTNTSAVLYLRHRMQKGFLARDQAPKEEEMDAMAELFSQLEGYDDLEASVIRNTKINKVLKGIVKLASIPKEEKYNFKGRSNDLLVKWSNSLDQNKGETPTTGTAAAETPAGDGESKANGEAAGKDDESVQEGAKEPVETAEPDSGAKDEAADVTMTEAAKDDAPTEAVDAGAEMTEDKTEDKSADKAKAEATSS